MTALLNVKNLTVDIEIEKAESLHAVRDISFTVNKGEKLGLVGESGSGKSLTALAIMRLLHKPFRISGSVTLDGQELYALNNREMARVRSRQLGIIYQDPTSSLNPVFTVGEQIIEAIQLSEEISNAEARTRAIDLLTEVGVKDANTRANNYPHQFSGGMRQRVMIAMAISTNPKLLIADEPTTALDVTTQARVMELLSRIVEQRGLAVILITHDLGVASQFCDRLSVMYGGKIVENGSIRDVISNPFHPYTKALIDSVCTVDLDVTKPMIAIGGQPPVLSNLPTGCTFHPRCPSANTTTCVSVTPSLEMISPNRTVACDLIKSEPHLKGISIV
jgi:oligopeptide/dipeptide ABC transporter ATP-binding protein